MVAGPEVKLRADARRNLGQILAAARTVFAETGPDVPMEEIARRAGVGVGTLYRRFPDREALVRAVARESLSDVAAEARRAVEESSSAWAALVRLLRHSRQLHVLAQLTLLSSRTREMLCDDAEARRSYREVLTTLREIVNAAQREGTLRDDVGAGDIAVVFSLLLKQTPATHTSDLPALERAFGLMLDGLRARTGTPLPGRPITEEDLLAEETRGS
ncbi:TetR/AcrR family transcriptional regulator [Saccharomonospora glauca]|jgi:AcrR family transcriptional regulator|uniref:Transcriptional regulator n=1 Tax=Saccharomonospora glauca K62 TaxID=928724 RepID=I1D7E2_9PSEU|nr:TetR/AcrR family transcriptional regulator [Saccharomonospora glauca]EIF00867.1 transcriptional regulator [Saccharomonospora glauca K62]